MRWGRNLARRTALTPKTEQTPIRGRQRLAGAGRRLRGHHMVDPAVPLRRIAII